MHGLYGYKLCRYTKLPNTALTIFDSVKDTRLRRFGIAYIVNIVYSCFMKHYTLFKKQSNQYNVYLVENIEKMCSAKSLKTSYFMW